MNKRITEAELRDTNLLHPDDMGESDWPPSAAIVAHRLIAEVCRLRGIILSEHESIVASRVAPITMAFKLEAEAIRAEEAAR